MRFFCFSVLVSQTVTIMTTLSELLGQQLLQHSTDGGAATTNYTATSQLNGKVIGLYFS